MKKTIVVAGSINQDLIITTPRMPKLGETITGSGYATAAGGKGANQAVAAARLGGNVTFIAAVGADEPGRRMKAAYESDGIDTSQIKEIPETPTGTAVITICGGDNCIILDPGANHAVTESLIDAAEDCIANASLMLLQLEIPIASVKRAIQLAQKHGTTVMLNPAPAVRLDADLLRQIDLLTPNESECGILTGTTVKTVEDAKNCVSVLMRQGVKQVIITMGEQGAVFNEGDSLCHQPACKIEQPVDTTAAGDCFNAAVAVALTEGASVAEAVRFAQKAAAQSVTRKGAQPSLPYRAELI